MSRPGMYARAMGWTAAAIAAFCCTVSSAAAQTSTAQHTSPPPQGSARPVQASTTNDGVRRAFSWDLLVEGGAGIALDGDLPHIWFARARAGVLLVQEPFIFALGATGEAGGLAELGVGLQADIMNLWTGLTGQLGAAYTKNESVVMHVAIGYSIFGLEWQHDFADDAESNNALFLKVRAPIGLIFALL